MLVLASLHAPYIDRHPVTVTVDYPVGIAVTLLGGYATQTGVVTVDIVTVAGVVALLLAGIKIGIDRLDVAFDQSIDKRTVPVVFGPIAADRVAAAVFFLTSLAVFGLVVTGYLSVIAVGAAAIPLGCLVLSLTVTPKQAVRGQMALTYLFVVILYFSVVVVTALEY